MYVNCHGPQHHAAAKHLLRYLKGTADVGLTYGMDRGTLALSGYSDADWGANLDTRRSITGYVFYLAGGPILPGSLNFSLLWHFPPQRRSIWRSPQLPGGHKPFAVCSVT
jgi:hypothetical protein